MATKMKLNLDELKVQSFVTSLKEIEEKEINGGNTTWSWGGTQRPFCCPDGY
jgi:hypothetical protein